MSKQDTDKPRFHPKFRHVVILTLLVLLVALGLFRYKLKCQLDDAYAQIRADGYPVTYLEQDQWYSIPDGVDNAADVLIEAFGYYVNWDEEREKLLPLIGEAKLPEPGEPIPDDMLKLIGEFLDENDKALELLHKGAAIEHCRYPVDLNLGIYCRIPHLGDIKRGARMLSLEAVYSAEKGQKAKAFESVKASFGLVRSLSNEPIFISHLVEVACRALTIISLENMLSRVELTDVQLAELYELIGDATSSEPFARALAGERCTGIDIFNMPVSEGADYILWSNSRLAKAGLAACKAIGLSDVDELLYIGITDDYIAAAKLPLSDAKKAFDLIDAKLDGLSNLHFILQMVAPSWESKARFEIKLQGQLLAALTAIATERYRLAEGHLPNDLYDLVPNYIDAIPIDPFDGKTIKYKKLEPGYVVYVIGEDGIDNSGQRRGSGRTEYDWPVRVVR